MVGLNNTVFGKMEVVFHLKTKDSSLHAHMNKSTIRSYQLTDYYSETETESSMWFGTHMSVVI